MVETFECVETASEPIEAAEEAVSLMEELELAGQLELVKPAAKGIKTVRCPYREITAEELFVYRTLCPAEVELRKYNAAPIPLRVLQIAAHAKTLGLFTHFYVWDKSKAEVKDPVLIATTKEYQWDTGFKRFILARWGEALETFVILRKQACDIHRVRLQQEADAIVNQIRAAGDDELMKHAQVSW